MTYRCDVCYRTTTPNQPRLVIQEFLVTQQQVGCTPDGQPRMVTHKQISKEHQVCTTCHEGHGNGITLLQLIGARRPHPTAMHNGKDLTHVPMVSALNIDTNPPAPAAYRHSSAKPATAPKVEELPKITLGAKSEPIPQPEKLRAPGKPLRVRRDPKNGKRPANKRPLRGKVWPAPNGSGSKKNSPPTSDPPVAP
jgi:hypothetical protein